jgi:uncharacterized membrane protein YfcA/uncharacterized membrane protein YedE/YeeE
MELALVLAVAIGVSLGLFGGGGSILTVPVLVYAAGLEPKPAIATSLLVVGVTAAAALVPHARAGLVQWRTGGLFGGAGMVGAFGGAWLARFVDGGLLLLLFAGMMVATAIALWRGARTEPPAGGTHPDRPVAKILAEGLAVGLFTGLVGAGGGFLVVPALALLGGLPMPAAVATSLLVVSVKSFAGFLGYLSHVHVDYALALGVSGAAVVGSVGGAWLARRLAPERLRRGFAAFVLAMAGFVLVRERATLAALPWPGASGADPLLLHGLAPLPWAAAGLAIGAITLGLLFLTGRRLGISTGLESLCSLALRLPYLQRDEIRGSRGWRLPFLAGLVLGGFLSAATSGGWAPFWDLGRFDAVFGWGPAAKLGWMFAGGLLIGFGTRLAGGCTSGHGIFGVSNLERASLESTLAFLTAGVVTTHLVYRLGGL